ncbi:MAG: SapC family protein [Rhodothalassiaceae bacterium]
MNDATPVENGAGAAAANVLPLFYSQPEVLRKDKHGDLGLAGEPDYSFAKTANAIPVTVAEFASAGLHYPIIFVGREQLIPVAAMGLEQGQNLFVTEEGRWDPYSYMPAYVRRYPFVFVRDQQNERFALCIDRASKRVNAGEGVRPFFDGEDMSDLTKQALDFCTAYQQEASQTERFTALMRELDLLTEKGISLTLRTGENKTINNIHLIDEEKLANLPDDKFLELRQNGALAVIYCHLMSQKAWQPLVARA